MYLLGSGTRADRVAKTMKFNPVKLTFGLNESAGEKVKKGFLSEFQINPLQSSYFVLVFCLIQSLNYKTWPTGKYF